MGLWQTLRLDRPLIPPCLWDKVLNFETGNHNLLSMIKFSRRNFPLCFSTHSLLATLFITVLLTSCSFILSKDNYFKSFSAFITDVKEHAASYTQDDWNKADLKYYKCAGPEYSNIEDKDIGDKDMERAKKNGTKCSSTAIKLCWAI